MKWLFFGVALVAGVGWTSAAQSKPLPTTTIHPAGAYVKWRVVGIRSPGQTACPSVGGWTIKQDLKGRPSEFQLDQQGFCIYTAQNLPSQPPAPFPTDLPGLAAQAYDRLTVTPAADPLDPIGEKTWKLLANQFIAQAGGGAIPIHRRSSGPSVRLVFVDTQPTGNGLPTAPGPSWHGYSLAHQAFQLVCPGMKQEDCPVEFATRLALKYPTNVRLDPDHQPEETGQGGDLGTPSDLAEAILEEVQTWQSDEPSVKLILNLSLGWDGELLDDLNPSKMDPTVQAVYQAVKMAADKGALVIAAAGNRRGGPQPSHWPVLPAAWELWHPSPEVVSSEKMIYAVGGTDGQGLPLANTRLGGQPVLVAYGDHAVADVDGTSTRPTAIYTGTSVSAAVISSVAAVVCHLRSSGPDLHAADVMNLISRSGEPLAIKADFFFPSGRKPKARRVSLCAAVASACAGGLCPEMTSPPTCSSWKPSVADLGQSVRESGAQTLKRLSFQITNPSPGKPCDSGQLWKTHGWFPQDPCPMNQFGGMTSQRWTGPQPGDDPCPGCTVVPRKPGGGGGISEALLLDSVAASPAKKKLQTPPRYTIALAVKPEWLSTPGVRVESAVFEINCYESGGLKDRISYALPPRALKAGIYQFSFDSIGPRLSLAGCTASVNFAVNAADGTKQSIQSPVYLDPELPR